MSDSRSKLFIVVVCLFLGACASEAEKQERRENAFDLAGGYKVTKNSGSEVNMNFTVENESGRHDIIVKLDRTSDFTKKERDFLSTNKLNPNTVFNHFRKQIVLGQGYNSDHLEGGENISDDFGESTKFFVCSRTFQYDKEHRLLYCLSGNVKKKNREMNGQLILRMVRERQETNERGEKVTVISMAESSLSYKSDLSLVFYRQYLGQWRGDVFPLVDNFDGLAFEGLRIQTFADESFAVNSTRMSHFEYGGEIFKYNQSLSSKDLSELRDPDYPAVQVVFKGEKTGRQIVLFGQLWSLGDFTGSIVLLERDQQTDLATFRHAKN